MQKVVVVTINELQYKVYELKVKQILAIGTALNNLPKGEGANTALLDLVKEWLPNMVSLKWDDLEGFAPSELEEVYNKFLAVNSSFLRILEGVGLKDALAQMIETFKQDLKVSFRGLLQQGT